MGCFCKNDAYVNLVKIYKDCDLIFSKEGYFEVVCLPKICIRQRLLKLDNKCKIRVIIKIFNYERVCFENICLVNELNCIPKDIVVNRIDGIWHYNNGRLEVLFEEIPELNVCTIDYCVCFDSIDFLESSVYLVNNSNPNVNNGKVNKCIKSIYL